MLQLFGSKQISSVILERPALIWKNYVIISKKFAIFKNTKNAKILPIAKISTYTIYTFWKSLQSPGTYISRRSWIPVKMPLQNSW